MKVSVTLAIVAVLSALPAISEDKYPLSVASQVIAGLPDHLHGIQHPQLADASMNHYALASTPLGGNESSFALSTARFHGPAVSDDLLAAYVDGNRTMIPFDAGESNGIRVLDLDEFQTTAGSYDWKRLNATYPDIEVVIRLSQPAVAGSYAMVRFEMISEAGPLWKSFVEYERNPAGEWRSARAVSGLTWE